MPSSPTPIWLICGGPSHEHEVSVLSCKTAAAHLDRHRFAATPVCIQRDGLWAICPEPLAPDAQAAGIESIFAEITGDSHSGQKQAILWVEPGVALEKAKSDGIQAVFLILHGPPGEDGTIQGMLDFVGVPYVGSGVLASALAMDKVRCQKFLGAHGLPTAPFVHQTGPFSGSEADDFAERIESEIGLPCVIKPSRAGSSVGITITRQADKIGQAVAHASKFDSLVMAERFLEGEETTCAVIEMFENGTLTRTAMPVTAIRPKGQEFFDYEAKYTPGQCVEITPAPISDEDTAQIQRLSLKAFEVVGCRDMARVDFILTEQGPVVLEINTIPGLTPTSLLPQGAKAGGIKFSRLLEMMIENCLGRS